ncbi:MAG: ATP-binding protein [Actinomycetota bacterium]|nr:ATP-binding protein [Actinomycetota bacterium]
MPRFIHLNGPPGIGKSTLARFYVDDHPGVLNLDIDGVRGMIGGWQDRFEETGEIARPIALGMAHTHLSEGRDVVMPQYLGRLSEIDRFEAVAVDTGAAFVEVVLMDTKERSIQRFTDRGDDDTLAWHRQVRDIVNRAGGAALLADMYDQLAEVIRTRTNAVVVPSVAGAVRQTYEAVAAVLDDESGARAGGAADWN